MRIRSKSSKSQHEACSQGIVRIDADLMQSVDPRPPGNSGQNSRFTAYFRQTQQLDLKLSANGGA